MLPKLLIIEPDVGAVVFDENRTAALCERFTWDAFAPESLRHSRANVIVVNANPITDKAVSFLQQLRRGTFAGSVLAIFPERSDRQLLVLAAEVTDDFLFSPLHAGELNLRIDKLLGISPQTQDQFKQNIAEDLGLDQLVGKNEVFLKAVSQIPRFASSDRPVLITGETGTGKEVFARAIHALGNRKDGPFVPVDCAVLSEQLAENELFGHRRGAFTDAHTDQKGLVAMAEGGTILLDEIDALSLPNQAKLLRLLQEATYRALGCDHFTRANVRVIAATNRRIEDCVKQRQFRSDLYFRINVLRLQLPPLRERTGDISLLARHFLKNECANVERKECSNRALRKLESYDWPGNVRELFNTVQRGLVISVGRQILPEHLTMPVSDADFVDGSNHCGLRKAKQRVIESFERTYIEELLARHNGNMTLAALDAGKERRTFGRLAKKYNLAPFSADQL